MNELEAIESRIQNLSPQDFAFLREWFYELEDNRWDQQIASDYKSGKFDQLIEKAKAELAQGKGFVAASDQDAERRSEIC